MEREKRERGEIPLRQNYETYSLDSLLAEKLGQSALPTLWRLHVSLKAAVEPQSHVSQPDVCKKNARAIYKFLYWTVY